MVTIALDEQGDFEQTGGNPDAPVFIGGILYDDMGSPNDAANEEKRLVAYFQRACGAVGKCFPRDLHMDRSGKNARSVAAVKQELKRSLPEFIQEGTYHGETLASDSMSPRGAARRGRYYVFADLKSGSGKRRLLGGRVSELVKDSFAGNLYIHMAEEITARLIFHNPLIPRIPSVRLELATRRVVLDKNAEINKIEELKKLRVNVDEKHSDKDTMVFVLTNPDVYRTAIEREMIYSGRDDVQLEELGVKSIYYGNAKDGMGFLYLADAVCSYLGYRLTGKEPSSWMAEFMERCRALAGADGSLLFGYDAVDTYFDRAWRRLEEGDYYKALSIAYDGMACGSEFAQAYRELWFSRIPGKLAQEKDLSAYTLAVRRLQESVRNNNINQSKLLYIYENLEKMKDSVAFGNESCGEILYELYETGAAAYAHVGNGEASRVCYARCAEYESSIGIERILRTRNRGPVLLNGEFSHKEALEEARENVAFHEQILEVRGKIFPQRLSEGSLGYAIAQSQLGQAYAFLKDGAAEACFLKAMGLMQEKGPDYFITESYLLHYYIEAGDQARYSQYAREYFGGKEALESQFKYLVREGAKEKNPLISMKYALFVWVKALSVFYAEEGVLPEKLVRKLEDIEEAAARVSEEAAKQVNGHPWELIYFHLSYLFLKLGQKDTAGKYFEKAGQILSKDGGKPEFTTDVICAYGRARYFLLLGEMAHAREELVGIYGMMGRPAPGPAADAAKLMEELGELVCYMYR